jgi:transcription-repair coupling factor (superfamily II helicase)
MLGDVRLATVHGKMPETRIEDVMARFIDQEYDILVSTNIIESGLDIPNANTLIVEDADHLGLAQLYQLRGRVGRSSRLAYAYFTFKPDKVITQPAEKRLEAIREFTELGAGYQIALRDLEIRGAGNLLGAEQHGFIASVGFDLYTQMLGEAIRQLKGEIVDENVDPAIEIEADAYLPDSYVPDARQKIEVYKRLVSARSLREIDDLAEEIEDRFGPAPAPVQRLVTVSSVRALARDLKLVSVGYRAGRLFIRGSSASQVAPDALRILASRYPGRLVPGAGRVPEIGIRVTAQAPIEEVLATAESVLQIMKGDEERVGRTPSVDLGRSSRRT